MWRAGRRRPSGTASGAASGGGSPAFARGPEGWAGSGGRAVGLKEEGTEGGRAAG